MSRRNERGRAEMSRRRFLQAGAAVATMPAWVPVARLSIGDATPTHAAASTAPTPTPPNFPPGIDVYRQMYENWSTEIRVDDVWTCTPRNVEDVVTLANWAHQNGWRLRPSGAKHGWAPFNVLWNQRADLQVLLVDTANLAWISVGTFDGIPSVTVGPGARMDDVLVALQREGRGWSSVPAPGDITVAGAIAINGHGAALPAAGETTPRWAFGSMSNRVVSLNAVVWDEPSNAYVVRGFHRSDKQTKALLTTMGRMFITSYTLATEPLTHLRCRSFMNIPGAELFAAPGARGRTFQSLVERAGRVEVIWFPWTESPWTKVWSVAPTKPKRSRSVAGAYNYPFSDNIPEQISDLATYMLDNHPEAAPEFGKLAMATSTQGVRALRVTDIWGPARNTQHYIKPTTIRSADFGWLVLTARRNIQRVLHDFVTRFEALNDAYRARGLYPANMPIELRCSGVDSVDGLGLPGAEPPSLSGTTPDVDHPEWDTAIWLNILSLNGTPSVYAFKREMERWIIGHYSGDFATTRVEWCKGWGFTAERDFSDAAIIDDVVPNALRRGRPRDANWDWTIRQFDALDPHRIFGNPFTDRLLK